MLHIVGWQTQQTYRYRVEHLYLRAMVVEFAVWQLEKKARLASRGSDEYTKHG